MRRPPPRAAAPPLEAILAPAPQASPPCSVRHPWNPHGDRFANNANPAQAPPSLRNPIVQPRPTTAPDLIPDRLASVDRSRLPPRATQLWLIRHGPFGIESSPKQPRPSIAFRKDNVTSRDPFLWRNGHMIDLGTLGGRNSSASSVNDRGEIVGSSQTTDGSYHSFLWRAGHMRDLGPLISRQINNRGQILG